VKCPFVIITTLFSWLRLQIEEVLRQRRIERDEKVRKKNEETKQLKRLEKLTAAYKKQQRVEAQKVISVSFDPE
jgi:hypothetical protein